MFSQQKNEQLGVLILIVLSLASLLLVFWLKEGKSDPVIDSWETGFAFATSTPKIDLFEEDGWWDEMATKKPSALPTMPDIDLLEATATPLPATQTALALTPSITPTRTPLFDVNATDPPIITPTKDE